jgi:hypothetical protein
VFDRDILLMTTSADHLRVRASSPRSEFRALVRAPYAFVTLVDDQVDDHSPCHSAAIRKIDLRTGERL